MAFSMHMKIRKFDAILSPKKKCILFSTSYGRELNRRKPIFNSALRAFTETILPNAQNADLIRSAREELAELLSGQQSNTNSHSHSYIGVHLRRGDRKAVSWEFHGKYVPIRNFIEAVKTTWSRLSGAKRLSSHQVYLASASGDAQEEFASTLPPKFPIFSLARSKKPALQALASREAYVQAVFNNLREDERIIATRGMIVDFALVNGMWAHEGDVTPAATICTIRFVPLPYSIYSDLYHIY
jgi:hypothetical protein